MSSESKITTKLVLVAITCTELLNDPENVYIFPGLAGLKKLAAEKVKEIYHGAKDTKQRKRWIRKTDDQIKHFVSEGYGDVAEGIPVEWVSRADGVWFRLSILIQLLDDVSNFKAVDTDALVTAADVLEDSFLACYAVSTNEYNLHGYARLELGNIYRRLEEVEV